jgi:para-aminobenzoate synthetase component 1
VDTVRESIARGDVYQVNVVGHQSAPFTGDPGPALRAVAGLPGAEYGAVLSGDGWSVATGSPECLVTVAGGIVETRPIKGTRPRTARGRAELYASAKERAEHVMIVDLERNDLARVAETGSVEVTELFTLRPWCDLWQAESVVRGRLRRGVGLAELLRAVCPGGSVTGAPKRSALAVIAGLEPVGRGPSMGALGWLGPSGLDLGLTIRTVAASAGRLHLWAGGGITWDSDPAAEVAEAAAKALPVRRAIAAAATVPWAARL